MKTFLNQSFLRLFIIMVLFSSFNAMLSGQVETALFDDTYKSVKIFHKASAWAKGNRADWVNNHPNQAALGDVKLQATYVYSDTIYMKKGSSYTLTLPDMLTEKVRNRFNIHINTGTYQRWYNYYTDGTFATGGSARVTDLLTRTPNQEIFNNQQAIKPFRLMNGYLGSPFSGLANGWLNSSKTIYQMDFYYPTDEEYVSWGLSGQSLNDKNDVYMVAVDVSNYKDGDVENFAGKISDGAFTEPTLTHRIIFYVCGVDGNLASDYEKAISTSSYQGGNVINMDGLKGKRFWEEYDITYPMHHFSYYTHELVALTKDAEAYAVPNIGDNSDTPLTVTLLKGEGTEVELLTSSLKGKNRIIKLDYKVVDNTGTMPVNYKKAGTKSGCKATLLVTKTVNGTTYNLARYNLTFMDGFQQLTQSQLKILDDKLKPMEVDWRAWKDYGYRTPKYLKEHYDELASITFDHPEQKGVEYISDLSDLWGWENSSYGFYNGGKINGLGWIGVDPTRPQWGNFAVTSSYIEKDRFPRSTDNVDYAREGNTHHMYIDASDRPGVIARLPFRANICRGGEIMVSAMVMSITTGEANDPAMLFTVMGVTRDGHNVKYTPIYRYQTGQIFNREAAPGGARTKNVPGWNREWKQVFFSFTNHNEMYQEYLLQVENNSSSTAGGDMCLDEIRIFSSRPRVDVFSLGPVCEHEDRKVQLFFPWGSLVHDESTAKGKERQLAICVIDTLNYHKAKDGEHQDIQSAIKSSQVKLFNGKKGCKLSYNDLFDRNLREYDKNTSDATVKDGDVTPLHRMISPSKGLAINLRGEFKTNRGYKVLVAQYNAAGTGDIYFPDPDDPQCSIVGAFSLESHNQIKLNAEIYGDVDLCEGQEYNFQVHLRGYDQATGSFTEISSQYEIYHDWFIGTKDEFLSKQAGCSLKEALEQFRAEYPDADNIAVLEENGTIVPRGGFTQEMLSLIKSYLQPITRQEVKSGGKLILYQSSMDIAITKPLDLVVMPIKNPDVDAQNSGLCWNYTTRTIDPSGKAPSLLVGFDDVLYPQYYKHVVRMGLKQIKGANDMNNLLRLPLHRIKSLTPGASLKEENNDTDRHRLFLIDTNDPAYRDLFHKAGFTEYDYPVGTVHKLVASEANASASYMDISFDLKGSLTAGEGKSNFIFNPREGYHYVLAFHFVESETSAPSSSQAVNMCSGREVFWLKVVPEYMRWIGNSNKVNNEDWSNRNNWSRVSRHHLNDPADYEDYDKTSLGLSPMDFTKIIIPRGASIVLEKPEYNDKYTMPGSKHKILRLKSTASVNGYRDVEFDLAVKSTGATSGVKYDCRTYYINEVAQVHFEPNSQMVGGEYLKYEKAWVDYELDKGRWYMLSSPYQNDNMFAGDWYTDKETAREGEIYFYDTFVSGKEAFPTFNTADNSRINPTVYQRSWDRASDLIISPAESKSVAISGDWSSLYNDVTVRYDHHGFSLKLMDFKNTLSGDKALFRFPKVDKRYSYYNYSNGALTESGKIVEIKRSANIGKLRVSELANRADNTFDIELRASSKVGGYYYFLVGNPFMSHLDMNLFFSHNPMFDKKYWYVTAGTQSVAISNEKGWIDLTAEQGNGALIAPLQSFFVKLKADNNANEEKILKVKFTADMQSLGKRVEGVKSDMLPLRITAADGERESRALIVYDHAASANYMDSEEAELFVDSNLGDAPIVYSVAGNQAVSINRTNDINGIPLGIFGRPDSRVTLTFEGVGNFEELSLYDIKSGEERAIMDGSMLVVDGDSHGRYFLRSSLSASEEPSAGNDIHIFSVGRGKLVVYATSEMIRNIKVHGVDGRLVRQLDNPATNRCTIDLPAGVYIVNVSAGDNQKSEKLIVR